MVHRTHTQKPSLDIPLLDTDGNGLSISCKYLAPQMPDMATELYVCVCVCVCVCVYVCVYVCVCGIKIFKIIILAPLGDILAIMLRLYENSDAV